MVTCLHVLQCCAWLARCCQAEQAEDRLLGFLPLTPLTEQRPSREGVGREWRGEGKRSGEGVGEGKRSGEGVGGREWGRERGGRKEGVMSNDRKT